MDLFTTASKNADAVRKRFDDLLDSLEKEVRQTIEKFADRVLQSGRVSVNMRQTVLNSFLTFGKHQNIHEWAEDKADRSKEDSGPNSSGKIRRLL